MLVNVTRKPIMLIDYRKIFIKLQSIYKSVGDLQRIPVAIVGKTFTVYVENVDCFFLIQRKIWSKFKLKVNARWTVFE